MSKVYVDENGIEWSVGDTLDTGSDDETPQHPGITFEQTGPGSWRVTAIPEYVDLVDPLRVSDSIVGEITTETDDGELRAYVEADRLGRGLVFLNFYADSDRGGFFFPVPLDAGIARDLAALLVKAADNADAGRIPV